MTELRFYRPLLWDLGHNRVNVKSDEDENNKQRINKA